MGYELNRIMQQYGISTPTVAPYTGASDPRIATFKQVGTEPVVQPKAAKAPVAASSYYTNNNATPKVDPKAGTKPVMEEVKFDPAQFADQLARYNADQAAYNSYKDNYNGRLQKTPMYAQAQFQPIAAPKTVQQLYNAYLERPVENAGMEYWTNRFGDNVNAAEEAEFARGATPEIQARGLDKNSQRVMNATGSYYSTPLSAPSYKNMQDLYQTYLTRPGEKEGVDYWTGRFGDSIDATEEQEFARGAVPELQARKLGEQGAANPATTTAPVVNTATGVINPNNLAGSDYENNLMLTDTTGSGMARGGRVGYAKGGLADMADDYEVDNIDGMQVAANDVVDNPFAKDRIESIALGYPKGPLENTPVSAANFQVPDTTVVPVAPQSAPAPVGLLPQQAPRPPVDDRQALLAGLLEKYQGGGESPYTQELKAARGRATAETEAFNKMLTEAVKGGADSAPSKAEMYFRLAAAFGAPTKTGGFAENLSKVGETLGEYAKETRASEKADRDLKLQLGIKGQEMKMTAAKDDLSTLRSLASEDMKDKRTITTELLKEYVKSGQPESSAGKQAKDEGLKPGTPEFQKRVGQIAEQNVEKQGVAIQAAIAGMTVAQANLALQRDKYDLEKTKAAKLTPKEVELKTEAENNVANMSQALKDLKEAYRLNPNTFDGSVADKTQRFVLENAGSEDPKVLATRTQENLLGKQGLAKLRATFGGNPTEGERAILLQLEGINSKSKAERASIMKNAYAALKTRHEREQKRLNEINQGLYRETTPAAGGIE